MRNLLWFVFFNTLYIIRQRIHDKILIVKKVFCDDNRLLKDISFGIKNRDRSIDSVNEKY